MTTVALRLAKNDGSDVPAMRALTAASPTAAQWSPDVYERIFSGVAGSTRRRVLVIEEQGEGASATAILGFVLWQEVGDEWEVENIVVAPDVQRRGLASQLLTGAIQLARKEDVRRIILEVRSANTAARGLYLNLGFQQTGKRSSYYSAPQDDALLFELSLG